MKKLLLSLLCLIGFLAAGANEVTFDFKKNNYGLTPAANSDYPDLDKTITYEGVSITLNKLTGSGVRYWGADNTFRINKNSGITVAAKGYKITSITFTGNNNLNKFSTGSTGTYNTSEHKWTGVSESVDFINDNGSTIQIETMKVVFSEDGTAEPEPEATTVKSVKETIALTTDTKVKVDYALTVGFAHESNVFCCDESGDFIQIYQEKNGLKVGDKIPAGWEATYKLFNNVTPELTNCTLPAEVTAGTFTPKEVAAADITKAMVNNVVMVKNVVFAEATPATKTNFTGKVGDTELNLRNNYTLASVPAGTYDLTLVVTIYNDEVSLYIASYNTGEEPVDPEPAGPTAVKSVKETIALASGTAIKVDYELTVAWVNVRNVFCCDAAGDFIQIYNENSLKLGDKIPAGWNATYTLYNGHTPEIEKATLPAEVTAGTFTPKAVTVADLTEKLVNSVVMVKDVVIAEATPAGQSNFTAKVGETEVTLRNHYKLPSVEAGTYEVTMVVTLTKEGAVSLYVINFKKTGDAPDQPVVPVEATVVKSVKETIAVADGTLVKIDYTLTVAWVNVRNIFCCDAAGDFIQIYATNSYKVGDVIPAGWEANYKLYNENTPELTDCTLPEEVTAGTFTAKEVAADVVTAALVNSVVVIKNVTLDAATPAADETDNNKKNFTGKVGDITLNFRNNYKVESVPAGTYDITVVVTLYNGEPSLYVTNFAKASGLDAVTVDADAPVEYFNLQGVRVENPENGSIYIRRQGSTVTKVMM